MVGGRRQNGESSIINTIPDMDTTLAINEIFFSLQGESTFAGEPCVFIRLAHCDLRCTWCDTEYAFFEAEKMTLADIFSKIEAFPTRLVEVTGGEPLLQKNVHILVERLVESGRKVLIETGGHRDISAVHPEATLIYDIKCPDSGMAEKNLWSNLPKLRPQDQVKFVLASRSDYDWAVETIRMHDLSQDRVILFSPVWDTLPPRQLAEWILQDGLPVRMQLQLHKILWDPKQRGV